jgi:hypothetical protein
MSASLAYGQAPIQAPYERVLIPIVVNGPGAFGSQWSTTLVVRNESEQPLVISPSPYGGAIAAFEPYHPHSTFRYPLDAVGNRGEFLYIGSPGIGKVTFALHVQDLSRQAETFGTTVPVVRDKDVYTGKLQLIDIPVTSDFRSALRVYDFDSNTKVPPVVRLRIYDMCGAGPFDRDCTDTPLVDTTLPLPNGGEESYTNPDHPGFAMIGDLATAFPQLAPQSRVRIDLDPVTADLRFWAFVSTTHNETQQVTVIAPN